MALLTPIYNLPNHVLEKQKLYQTSPKPIMLRGPRSGLYVGVYGALFVTGMVSTLFGLNELFRGKKAE
ncbi:hypothetical protein BYT27DRAFT_7191571 [Phlegmacium glaucopus]|nr:hypothetical protein BYT27DRAFT_7191571 [Phlegmacium glaucopus]